MKNPRLQVALDRVFGRIAKWHTRFLKLAIHIEDWSKDPSMKVGAVVVDEDNRVLSMGYNGFPKGVEDTDERYEDRSLKYPIVVHAEVNAVVLSGSDLTDATLYCSRGMPCADCMGVIIQSGIKKVVFCNRMPKRTGQGQKDWNKLSDLSEEMADEAGVEVIEITGM